MKRLKAWRAPAGALLLVAVSIAAGLPLLAFSPPAQAQNEDVSVPPRVLQDVTDAMVADPPDFDRFGALLKEAPRASGELVSRAMLVRPQMVGQITDAAVRAVPDQLDTVLRRLVQAAPDKAAVIAQAAVKASPSSATQVSDIIASIDPTAAIGLKRVIQGSGGHTGGGAMPGMVAGGAAAAGPVQSAVPALVYAEARAGGEPREQARRIGDGVSAIIAASVHEQPQLADNIISLGLEALVSSARSLEPRTGSLVLGQVPVLVAYRIIGSRAQATPQSATSAGVVAGAIVRALPDALPTLVQASVEASAEGLLQSVADTATYRNLLSRSMVDIAGEVSLYQPTRGATLAQIMLQSAQMATLRSRPAATQGLVEVLAPPLAVALVSSASQVPGAGDPARMAGDVMAAIARLSPASATQVTASLLAKVPTAGPQGQALARAMAGALVASAGAVDPKLVGPVTTAARQQVPHFDSPDARYVATPYSTGELSRPDFGPGN
ncbi:hypothetical protein [Radicibacter daui]|uniref:hypothetical protein n=1 Tax=Radicibacter daui TaxID=3064829 RepID=UPI0040468D40